jgi:hypothetical protein
MELDHAFLSKNEIAEAVKNQLAVQMSDYGYEILGKDYYYFVFVGVKSI